MDPGFIEEAAECGLRPLAVLLGAVRDTGLASRVLSYEGPFGVGYPVVAFTALSARLDLQALGRHAIEAYLRTREIIEPPEPIPAELDKPAAVFVTLEKDGQLRGCVGSMRPSEPTAVHEFIRYAVAAALRDPRFEPVRLTDVPHLHIKAQVLDPPEQVTDPTQLDPTVDGIIVSSGDRTALLLPGIASIRSPEEQVRAACEKAGINALAPITIERFRVRTLQ
jgi:AmmeMemoRadiSam system protein A